MGKYIDVQWRASLGLIGAVMLYLMIPLLFPLVVALYYGESIVPFVVTIAVTGLIGAGLRARADIKHHFGPREAFLAVAVVWFLVALVGAIPFVIAGQGSIAHPVNALFESMSGLTTTGATVLDDFAIDRSVMMWRQLIQWLGGLGILILVTAILSELGVGGAQLMETEKQMTGENRLTPRISATARLIFGLYTGLTLLVIAVLYSLHLLGYAPNITMYNAVAHGFTSISTAGFSPEPNSIAAFSPAVQWTLIPVMLLGSTSFILLYYAIHGNPWRLLNNEEFQFYLGTFAILAVGASTIVFFLSDLDLAAEESVRHAIFNVTSILTTTGYASMDFNLWPAAALSLLFLAMFVGGMVGSTTCSIKTLRWLVLVKALRRNLFTAIHPDAIRPIRISGNPIEEETVRDVFSFVLLSIVIFVILTLVIVVDGARAGVSLSEFEAMGAAAATFLNIGPAFGMAGPMENYLGFPMSTRFIMIVLMWLGRIEIIPVLVLFTYSFWRS